MSSTGASDATSERPGPSREWSKTTLGKEMDLYSSFKHMISARVQIDITSDKKVAGRPSFSGGYRGAGSGAAAPMASKKNLDLQAAGHEYDMDEKLGIHHHPGTAGAHPIVAQGPIRGSSVDAQPAEQQQQQQEEQGSLMDRMWSFLKAPQGETISLKTDHQIAGRPSFTGGFGGAAAAGAAPIAPARKQS